MHYDKVQCKWVRLARQRQERDMLTGPDRGLVWNRGGIERFVAFSRHCRQSKGEWAGKPIEFQRWQLLDILYPLFGWYREDGTRRFREGYIEICRKNGKSTIISVVGNYLFIADKEPGAEVYSVATKKDQAKIIHAESIKMIEASPKLLEYVTVYKENLSVFETGSKFEPLGADSNTLDGLNVHGGLADELHAHKDRLVYDLIDTATAARRQPLILGITTAGQGQQGICWEKHEYATAILEGLIEDDSFFAYICTIDDPEQWQNPELFYQANPNLGVSCKMDTLERNLKKAQRSAEFENTFKRLHLNIWTEQAVRWLKLNEWDQCVGHIDPQALKGERCRAGLDLSTTTDLTSFVLVFRTGKTVKLLPFFWIPEAKMQERSRKDQATYVTWVKKGLVRITPGNVIDYEVVRRDIHRIADMYHIEEIGFDPWNATGSAVKLEQDGLVMVQVRQGFNTMNEPTKEFERMILSRELEHGGNEVLRWMARHVTVETDAAGNIKPSKKYSSDRIDGIVASIIGLSRIIVAGDAKGSVYEERGLRQL